MVYVIHTVCTECRLWPDLCDMPYHPSAKTAALFTCHVREVYATGLTTIWVSLTLCLSLTTCPPLAILLIY